MSFTKLCTYLCGDVAGDARAQMVSKDLALCQVATDTRVCRMSLKTPFSVMKQI